MNVEDTGSGTAGQQGVVVYPHESRLQAVESVMKELKDILTDGQTLFGIIGKATGLGGRLEGIEEFMSNAKTALDALDAALKRLEAIETMLRPFGEIDLTKVAGVDGRLADFETRWGNFHLFSRIEELERRLHDLTKQLESRGNVLHGS